MDTNGSGRKAYVTVEFMPDGNVKVSADANVNELVVAAYHIQRTAYGLSSMLEQQAAIHRAEIIDVADKLKRERRT